MNDIFAFIIVIGLMIFAVVYGMREIRETNKSIEQLERIKKQIKELKKEG